MKAYIAVPYTQYQNEPSRPCSELIVATDDDDLRLKAIRLFNEIFDTDEEDDPIAGPEHGYGDYAVRDQGGDALFLTEVSNPVLRRASDLSRPYIPLDL